MNCERRVHDSGCMGTGADNLEILAVLLEIVGAPKHPSADVDTLMQALLNAPRGLSRLPDPRSTNEL
jgi:hypothetical protein